MFMNSLTFCLSVLVACTIAKIYCTELFSEERAETFLFFCEKAVADVEKAIVDALEKQYADVLAPLKENLAPKRFGLKYVQKLARRNVSAYMVPDEVSRLILISSCLIPVTVLI